MPIIVKNKTFFLEDDEKEITKKGIKEMIEYADNEITEWQKFKKDLLKKLK